MNLLDFRTSPPPEKAHQHFLELWYEMTHQRTLDTYRVRCLNSRTIVRELDQEIQIGRIKPKELSFVYEEAIELLDQDLIITNHFIPHTTLIKTTWALIKTKIQNLEKEKGKGISFTDPDLLPFRYAIADFSVALEKSYTDHLFLSLTQEIEEGINLENITNLTASILSNLVDKGWPLETLHSLTSIFTKKPHPHPFKNNFEFLLRILKAEKQNYTIILRLNGGTRLLEIKDFNNFKFLNHACFKPGDREEQKFGRGPLTVFAHKNVQAIDYLSAAITAREQFEACLDHVRFNFEHRSINIDKRSIVIRSDKKTKLVKIRHLVPNPRRDLHLAEFQRFSNELNQITQNPQITPSTIESLTAAIRLYRLGSDADTYKDKFLHWWMGLEFLTNTESNSSIGDTVNVNTSNLLLLKYLQRSYSDLLETLNEQKIEWSAELATASTVEKLSELDSKALYRIITDQPAWTIIEDRFKDSPLATHHLHRLKNISTTPANTRAALQKHHNHLIWHLYRLYRIRCCIVHGSAIRFNLPLFTANLEYYLKELISIILNALTQHPHLKSRQEIFQRASITRKRIFTSLDTATLAQTTPAQPNSHATLIENSIFNDIVSRF